MDPYNTSVQGAVADNDPDAGRPVKVGGKYNATPPTYADGDRGDAQITSRGALKVSLVDPSGTGTTSVSSSAGDGTGADGVHAIAKQFQFNGSTWDRARGNTDVTLLASAARTASNDTADQTNYSAKGLHLVIDVTASSATPSVVFTLQGKDAVSGKYYTILASAAITGAGTTVLRVHPGLTAAANLVANDVLPRTWRVSIAHADADSITYSVGASLIVG